MTFNPDAYTIIVRLENHDGESYYVGRVLEFPNISAFEDSAQEARNMVIDALETLKTIADEDGISFPAPYPVYDDEYSGRISLRLPKSLHAKVAKQAEKECVSINTLLVSAISSYTGEENGISKMLSSASHVFEHFINCQQTAMLKVLSSFVIQTPAYNFPTQPRLVSASTSGVIYGK